MPITTLQILFMYLLKDTPITLFLQNPISEQLNIGQSIARGFIHVSIIYAFIIVVFLIKELIPCIIVTVGSSRCLSWSL